MPELPDVAVYIESLEARIVGHRLERILLKNPFLLRTAEPPLQSVEGHVVTRLRRLGKRIAIGLDNDVWLALHLMIAGRLHWYEKGHRGKVRAPLLQLDFDNGALTLTEAGTKRRASLHVVAGEAQLEEHDRGGLEVLGVEPALFRSRMSERNHTLKRALTDPTILSGIGNAYSDVIVSPIFRYMGVRSSMQAVLLSIDATRARLNCALALARHTKHEGCGIRPALLRSVRDDRRLGVSRGSIPLSPR